VRDRFILHPLIHGGANQEFGLRAGTENVPGIAGLAAAISTLDVHETCIWTSTLKQRFFMAIQSRLKDAGYSDRLHINGPSVITPGKTLNVRVDGVDGQSLLLMLSSVGVCCSAGSACTSRENKPSHVLKAMGLTDDQARSSLRFSFSKYNTVEEILAAADAFSDCVEALLGGTSHEREN
jgi:cysteine desulfurase